MKHLLLILIAILSISCSVEQRIKDHSYTDEWYYDNAIRYQVYKTKSGCKYIIRLNKKETRFKRQYIKTPKNGQ
jgi:predicted glycosyltransferase